MKKNWEIILFIILILGAVIYAKYLGGDNGMSDSMCDHTACDDRGW